MGAIEHLTIRLPGEVAEQVRSWVADGHFDNLDAAILQGLRELGAATAMPSEVDEDAWVRREVLPALDRYDADRSRGLTIDQVRERLSNARWARERPTC